MALLIIAGHETSVNLIGNGMRALLCHPDQFRLLRDRPELLPAAVEELLRFDGPGNRASARVATEDMEIAGVPVSAGSIVHVSLAGANRDPAAFAQADRLDVTRPESQHLGFGHGIHYCLGAPLARIEGQVAFGTLLRRFPEMSLVCPPEELAWRPRGAILRGLVALPVRLR